LEAKHQNHLKEKPFSNIHFHGRGAELLLA